VTQGGSSAGLVRTAHASGLGAVERELAALHKEMLRAGGDEARAVRLSVVTLVVACVDDAEAERAAEVVSAIAAEHPARALLVTARRDDPPGLEAELRLECSVRGGPSTQVCAEIVRLRVGGEPALHLASVVAPLLIPDVPVHLWLAGAPALDQALAPDTLRMVERLIVDTDAFPDAGAVLRALAGATHHGRPHLPVVDLAWLRMEPWRDLVARAFDASARRPLLGGVDLVEVSATATASARLAAGWVVARLGLDPSRIGIRVEPAAPGEPAGLRSLLIRSTHAGGSSLSVHRDADGLRTAVVIGGETVARRAVPLDPPSTSDLVGAALQEGGADPIFEQALAAAVELAE
jgi:glucose-6-phosphate dehydrogenase assembly protein OpcA